MKLQTFCHLLWPKQVLWHLDFDENPIEEVLTRLSAVTGASMEAVTATSLKAYGRHLSNGSGAGTPPWILALGTTRFLRRLFGQQFCPACLAQRCYLRKEWRLAFVTSCPEHRSMLMDRCPRCETPLHFHRVDMGDRNSLGNSSPAICFCCKFDLREAKPAQISKGIIGNPDQLQARLLQSAETGCAVAPDGSPLYSHLYFRVLRQLIKLLTHTRVAERLRQAVGTATGFDSGLKDAARDFERESIAQRALLLQMAAWLLEEWPHRFVSVCRGARIYSSVLLRDMADPPFWYWKVVREHLFVVYTPWRDRFEKTPNSYATLARTAAEPSARVVAERKRIEFVRQHRHLWRRRRSLAQALSAAGHYSRKVHFSQVMKACPRFVAICQKELGEPVNLIKTS